jgi:hypothetical protein
MNRTGLNFPLLHSSLPNIDIESFHVVVTEPFSTSAKCFRGAPQVFALCNFQAESSKRVKLPLLLI